MSKCNHPYVVFPSPTLFCLCTICRKKLNWEHDKLYIGVRRVRAPNSSNIWEYYCMDNKIFGECITTPDN